MECLRSIAIQTVLDIAYVAKNSRLTPAVRLDDLDPVPAEDDLEAVGAEDPDELLTKLRSLTPGERNELMVLAWMGHEGIPFSTTIWSDLLAAAGTQSDDAKNRYISGLNLLDIYLERALKLVDSYQTA